MSIVFASSHHRANAPLDTATIQKMLDENAQMIQAIVDYQQKGKVQDAAHLQGLLHRNLVYLATVADQSTTQTTPHQPQQSSQPQQQTQSNAGITHPQGTHKMMPQGQQPPSMQHPYHMQQQAPAQTQPQQQQQPPPQQPQQPSQPSQPQQQQPQQTPVSTQPPQQTDSHGMMHNQMPHPHPMQHDPTVQQTPPTQQQQQSQQPQPQGQGQQQGSQAPPPPPPPPHRQSQFPTPPAPVGQVPPGPQMHPGGTSGTVPSGPNPSMQHNGSYNQPPGQQPQYQMGMHPYTGPSPMSYSGAPMQSHPHQSGSGAYPPPGSMPPMQNTMSSRPPAPSGYSNQPMMGPTGGGSGQYGAGPGAPAAPMGAYQQHGSTPMSGMMPTSGPPVQTPMSNMPPRGSTAPGMEGTPSDGVVKSSMA